MDIFQMSLSAGVLIIVIVMIRALGLNKLPKITFLALWGVAAFRLLIPFAAPSRFSIYNIMDSAAAFLNPKTAMPSTQSSFVFDSIPTGAPQDLPMQGAKFMITPMYMVWIMGAAAVAIFFAVAYYKNCKELRMALPIRNNAVLDKWRGEHKLFRSMQVLMSDRITTPIAVGILKPRIILPKTMDFNDKRLMRYVLTHEYQHIKHFDVFWKLVLIVVLIIHWFNPLVWVMFVLANRDLEIACDEKVLTAFGEETRSEYATKLIDMAERKSKFTPLYNGFSKNATEERIESIMKFKRASIYTIIFAVLLVAGVTTAFATASNGQASDGDVKQKSQNIERAASHSTTGEPDEGRPPYTVMNSQAFKDFSEFLQYDDKMHLYRFDGKWVRTLYDENFWNGKYYSGLSRHGITDNPDDVIDWGKPIDLRTVRNPQTNKVEKLVEMTDEETQKAISRMAPKYR